MIDESVLFNASSIRHGSVTVGLLHEKGDQLL